MTLTGHTEPILGLSFSADGETLCSGGRDGVLKLWNVASGQQVWSQRGHTDWISDVLSHPHEPHFVSAGFDEAVRGWRGTDGDRTLSFDGHIGPVLGLAYAPGGQTLATGGRDGQIRVWDALSGQEQLTLAVTEPCPRLAFSANGAQLAVLGESGAMTWWSIVHPDASDRRLAALPAANAEALQAELRSDWPGALTHLHPLIAAQPENAELWRRRARSYAAWGDFAGAASDWSAAESLGPLPLIDRLDWALTSALSGNDEPAQRLIQEAADWPLQQLAEEELRSLGGLTGGFRDRDRGLANRLRPLVERMPDSDERSTLLDLWAEPQARSASSESSAAHWRTRAWMALSARTGM